MRLLLDTHVLVWAMGPGRQMPAAARALLLDARNTIYFSVVSIFEIAAKRAAARRSAPQLSADRALELADLSGYIRLDLKAAHAIAVESIAVAHPDPFDKLLLAQAQVERLRFVTHDGAVAAHDSNAILF